MAERIAIRHPETGATYAVRPATFHARYEPEGYVADGYVDGAPYAPPQGKRRKGGKAGGGATDDGATGAGGGDDQGAP